MSCTRRFSSLSFSKSEPKVSQIKSKIIKDKCFNTFVWTCVIPQLNQCRNFLLAFHHLPSLESVLHKVTNDLSNKHTKSPLFEPLSDILGKTTTKTNFPRMSHLSFSLPHDLPSLPLVLEN